MRSMGMVQWCAHSTLSCVEFKVYKIFVKLPVARASGINIRIIIVGRRSSEADFSPSKSKSSPAVVYMTSGHVITVLQSVLSTDTYR
jgi:hypothetical protein